MTARMTATRDAQKNAISWIENYPLNATGMYSDNWRAIKDDLAAALAEVEEWETRLAELKACWGADGVRVVREQRAINAQVVRRAEAAEAERDKLREMLDGLVDHSRKIAALGEQTI